MPGATPIVSKRVLEPGEVVVEAKEAATESAELLGDGRALHEASVGGRDAQGVGGDKLAVEPGLRCVHERIIRFEPLSGYAARERGGRS